MKLRTDRRTLLLTSAGVVGAFGALYGGTIGAGALKNCPAPGTLSASETSLAHIGEIFLRDAATADERARLARLARAVNAASTDQCGEILREAAAALAAAPGEDFARGDVVSCAGWVLARGEAMACALVALTRSPAGMLTQRL